MRSAGWVAHMEGQRQKEQREAERAAREAAYHAKRQAWLDEHTAEERCPKCGDIMYIMNGKYGKFLSCSNYPKCNGTLEYGDPIICPQCGREMRMRRGSKGLFYGCSDYPNCKATLNIVEAKNQRNGILTTDTVDKKENSKKENIKKENTEAEQTGRTAKRESKLKSIRPEELDKKQSENREEMQWRTVDNAYLELMKKYPENSPFNETVFQFARQKHDLLRMVLVEVDKRHSNFNLRDAFCSDFRSFMLEKSRLFKKILDDIDYCGGVWLEKGISEEAVKEIIALFEYARSQSKAINDSLAANGHPRFLEENQGSDWIELKKCLPSTVGGTYALRIYDTIQRKRAGLSVLQEKEIGYLAAIETREPSISALKQDLEKLRKEVDQCNANILQQEKQKQEELLQIQKKLEKVLEKSNSLNHEKTRLESELNEQSIFAFKRKKTLKLEIEKCNAVLEGEIKEKLVNGEQKQKEICSAYSVSISETQAKANRITQKQKETQEKLEELERDLTEHLLEKKLEDVRLEQYALEESIAASKEDQKKARRVYLLAEYNRDRYRYSCMIREWSIYYSRLTNKRYRPVPEEVKDLVQRR